MHYTKHLVLACMASLLVSCSTQKEIAYFQDIKPGEENTLTDATIIRIRPEDKILIFVNSKDPELAALFNLPQITPQAGSSSRSVSQSSNNQVLGFTVDSEGYIDYPIIGKIYVQDMTREEIAKYIKNELISRNLIKDPVVTVEFMNLTIAVLGEVSSPGRYSIDRDKITILEALSMAGDLTINGKRDNVQVLRNVDNKQVTYTLDLRSAKDIYTSPAYYLQQNDVIYVEPNSKRARESTVNGNNVRSASFWVSIASLTMTIATTIITIFAIKP